MRFDKRTDQEILHAFNRDRRVTNVVALIMSKSRDVRASLERLGKATSGKFRKGEVYDQLLKKHGQRWSREGKTSLRMGVVKDISASDIDKTTAIFSGYDKIDEDAEAAYKNRSDYEDLKRKDLAKRAARTAAHNAKIAMDVDATEDSNAFDLGGMDRAVPSGKAAEKKTSVGFTAVLTIR